MSDVTFLVEHASTDHYVSVQYLFAMSFVNAWDVCKNRFIARFGFIVELYHETMSSTESPEDVIGYCIVTGELIISDMRSKRHLEPHKRLQSIRLKEL